MSLTTLNAMNIAERSAPMRCPWSRYGICFACVLFLMCHGTAAAVQSRTIEYEDDGVALSGSLSVDDAVKGRRPGVLVVHEWWGLNDYAKKRAEQLAAMGYVAFALDMYGEGKVAEHPTEAGTWSGQITRNVKQWQQRALAGLKVLRSQPQVDPKRLAAIGYCFGGATVLQLAYSGTDIAGVVSFHGSLPPPDVQQASGIKARILICHGASDGFIPQQRIDKLRAALEGARSDWQMITYGGAVHSFTNPAADKRDIKGLAYNEKADRRSWGHMKMFFDEIFRRE